jgi:DUF971 family protein
MIAVRYHAAVEPPALIEARRLPESEALRLTWSDGHAAEFPYPYLRGYCPCAACQGHHALRVVFRQPPPDVTLRSIEPVGHYGLSLLFSDGHGTGIYRHDFLRRICPCSSCTQENPS